MSVATMFASLKRDRTDLERAFVALLALVVSGTLGVMAHRRLTPLRREVTDFRLATQTVQSFHTSFRPMTAEEENRWVRALDSLEMGIQTGARLPVAESVARIAEIVGLHNVRVGFSPPDSTFLPPRGNGPSALTPADYLVAIEGEGSFQQALGLLNALPPYVSVVQFRGVRANRIVRYRILLAVYESANANRTG